MERLPLFERNFVKKLTEQRLEAVAQAIKDRAETEPEPGFLTGLAGQALFFYVYGRAFGLSRYENLGFLALERTIGMINDGFSWPTHAAGLSGIRFVLKYLASQGFIALADGDALDEALPALQEFAVQRFAAGDYDFLHGALGPFLPVPSSLPSRDWSLSPEAIEQPDSETSFAPGSDPTRPRLSLPIALRALAIEPAPGLVAWPAKHPQSGTPEINLGLAHGIPSILWSLSHLAGDPEADRMLAGGVAYLLSCRQDPFPNGSVYPHRMIDGQPDQPGRLAWCYGDPGVGAALWQVGSNAGRPDWQADAISLLRQAAGRRKMTANRVHDACICHGTAGLALIFYKMALLTGHDELLDAASHWARATLDHGQNEGGAAGYRFLTTGGRYIPSYSFLEGIAGVGLTLIALLDADTLGWEQGILL